VLAVVVDENAKLREEIKELKAQIKQLQEQTEVKEGPAGTP
jgi:cell division protein FtsB